MLTAAVRDLHCAYPGRFLTDVRTSADALWENNPYITHLPDRGDGIRMLDMHYPAIHQSNQRPYHFIHGYAQYLEQQLDLKIPVTSFHGDIYLTAEEMQAPPRFDGVELPERFWIVVAGGKYDFTAKWWSTDSFQAVIDHFRGRVDFVQCGEKGHWHPQLEHVTNLIGKTSLRQLARLMHFADGVLCPVTFAMHLAAAVVTRRNGPATRACVVVAGGREPPHWEAYPHHQFISTSGMLSCCAQGGCWRSRCQVVGDGDDKDRRHLCEYPVQVASDLRIPRCMHMITPEDVIRRIEMYYEGGMLSYRRNEMTIVQAPCAENRTEQTGTCSDPLPASARVLIRFRHGLGDAMQLTAVLQHLRYYRPGWSIDVAALVGKHSAFRGLCDHIYLLEKEQPQGHYDRIVELHWDECATCYAHWPSTKAERCLLEDFHLEPIAELCRYRIEPQEEDRRLARRYFERICKTSAGNNGRFPVVLIHYEGNTSAQYKNLPVPLVKRLCDEVLRMGTVPVILDWDFRTPLADGERIHNPHVDLELWRGTGTGDAAVLAALIELAALVVGVDSGPLHVAGASATPTIGVWTRHHPLHYFGLADNVVHLVPEKHTRLLRGDSETGKAFFEANYPHQTYTDLEPVLLAAVRQQLMNVEGALLYVRNYWIRSNNAEQDLVVVQDIDEQDSYQIDQFPMPRPVVVDVGAHIGCFSKRLHERNPLARIVAVECCPENIAALEKNIGGFATIVQAAATYDSAVALMNAVFPGCVTTGGSVVVGRKQLENQVAAGELTTDPKDSAEKQYWADLRPVATVTLEELLETYRLDGIDVLKLDCEGSEFSILRNATSLDRIGLIVGEYHGRDEFMKLVEERFSTWDLKILKDGELGVFWLVNPQQRLWQHETPSVVAAPRLTRRRASGMNVDRSWPLSQPVLVAALRNLPTEAYDLLLISGGKVEKTYTHPQGWLRGFTRLGGKLWTIDSRGVLYRVRLRKDEITLREVAASPMAWEAHDLTVIDDCLATAGAVENAVVLYCPQTGAWSARRPWVPTPVVSTEQDGDQEWDRYHVNSVVQDGNDLILSFFSAFTKPRDKRWRETDLEQGLIVRWGAEGFSEHPIARGVYAPHSLRKYQGQVWWCDSFRGLVRRADGWRSPYLRGFVRGLAFKQTTCIVGLSRSRVPPYPTFKNCGLCLFQLQHPHHRHFMALEPPYIEVYDVAVLEPADFDDAASP